MLLPYGFLLLGAIRTNVENLLFHDVLNFIEHSVGNLGAGIAMAVLAYVHRHRIRETAYSPNAKEDD